jgi:hypothetical protein
MVVVAVVVLVERNDDKIVHMDQYALVVEVEVIMLVVVTFDNYDLIMNVIDDKFVMMMLFLKIDLMKKTKIFLNDNL